MAILSTVYTSAKITTAAKKALIENRPIDTIPVGGSIEFRFQSNPENRAGYRTDNSTDWFEYCKKQGLQDLKLASPTKDNPHCDCIVCYWADQTVTFFFPIWKENKLVYTEYAWSDASTEKPCYENNTEAFKDILIRIEDLALRVKGGQCFAQNFNHARGLLNGTEQSIAEEIRLFYDRTLSWLPTDRKALWSAACYAHVFGMMGTWDDTPRYEVMIGDDPILAKEFNRISGELARQIDLAILYAVNEW